MPERNKFYSIRLSHTHTHTHKTGNQGNVKEIENDQRNQGKVIFTKFSGKLKF